MSASPIQSLPTETREERIARWAEQSESEPRMGACDECGAHGELDSRTYQWWRGDRVDDVWLCATCVPPYKRGFCAGLDRYPEPLTRAQQEEHDEYLADAVEHGVVSTTGRKL